MQKLAVHWADQTAQRLVSQRPNQDTYVVASGITPSGRVHVGNFREVITVDLVAKALREMGKQVRFIYSWDNFDTFRKVPKNVPDPAAFQPYLFQPIARIPDPWGQAKDYASGRIALFEEELKRVGIDPLYRYQHDEYSSGRYSAQIRQALQHSEDIRGILNKHRTEPLPETWLPTSVYCESCQRDHDVEHQYDGDWSLSYQCGACGHEGKVDLRHSRQVKLAWRTDWPMRWAFEKVDFEPGGKDHSSRGGSFDTGKEIVKVVWDWEAPVYLQYDFVAIKGGAGKMSSSSGELYSLSDVLEVYEPQIVRWIFASQRPNHDFSLAFDEDVIKTYEEFDRAEEAAYSVPNVEQAGKLALTRRTYELSSYESAIPSVKPLRVPFRELCNRLQICGGDMDRTFQLYYQEQVKTPADIERYAQRAKLAWFWITQHAPEDFRYSLRAQAIARVLEPWEKQALALMKDFVANIDLLAATSKEINDRLYSEVIHPSGIEPKAFFVLIYEFLVGRPQGPRLPSFLKEIGRTKLLALLEPGNP